MGALNTLKLIAAQKPVAISPVLQRRGKLSKKLVEQLEIAKALQEGRQFAPTKQKKVKDDATGELREISVPKRVKPWWFQAEGGKLCVIVRYGSKTLELAKGKGAVEVGSAKELVGVLTTLKKATEAGELDTQIEAASMSVKKGFKR
jgi:predicted nicotinamide N-methyase